MASQSVLVASRVSSPRKLFEKRLLLSNDSHDVHATFTNQEDLLPTVLIVASAKPLGENFVNRRNRLKSRQLRKVNLVRPTKGPATTIMMKKKVTERGAANAAFHSLLDSSSP
jgi:hypothetical protein